MKTNLLFALVLSAGYANAQEGNVGINTTTPNATLEVKSKTGTTNATKNLELKNAANTNLVTVLDDGKVGIGTATPAQKLEVDGNVKISGLAGTDTDIVYTDAQGNLKREAKDNVKAKDRGTLTCSNATLGERYAVPWGTIECVIDQTTSNPIWRFYGMMIASNYQQYAQIQFVPSGKISQPHDPTGQTLKFEESTVFDNNVKNDNTFPEGGTTIYEIYSDDRGYKFYACSPDRKDSYANIFCTPMNWYHKISN